VPYDPVSDFVPLDLLAESYHVLVVNPAVAGALGEGARRAREARARRS
jgi:hypothetical protein